MKMLKKIILAMIALMLLLPWQVYEDSIPMPSGMSCEGSQMSDRTYIPKGQVKKVTYGGGRYRCVGCGEYTPISSGSSIYTPSYVPSSRLTPSQQMAIGIIGSFLNGFFGTLFSGMFDTQDDSAQKQAQYEAEQKRIAQEEKQKAFQEWLKMQEEVKTAMVAQEAEKKEEGQRILAKSGIESSSGGLTPFPSAPLKVKV